MLTRNSIAALLVFAFVTYSAHADVVAADPSNYLALLSGLQPGDVLQLAAGTYTQGLPLAAKAGTAAAPIVIRGPEDQSAIFIARDCCNTVQLDGTSYVQLSHLTLAGDGKIGPTGVDSRGDSHHVTIENLEIVAHSTGISAQTPAGNWIVRDSTIIGAQTGIDLGSSESAKPSVADVIESNAMLDSEIGLRMDDSRTLARNNVFANRSATAEGKVTIAAATPNPTVTLSASPAAINAGETTLLSWTSTDAGACAASQGWTGTKAASGMQTVGPLQAATTFQLDCFGDGGQASATIQVTIGAGGGGGSTPTPPTNPPTTPPPSTPPPTTPTDPPSSSAMSSGGGGAFDALSVLALLTLLGARTRAPARVGARRSSAG